jgi:mannose-6-phosphate isomerase-like protein (cupin superfamily)
MRRVEQPWGFELYFAETDRYEGKVLVIDQGRSLPRQYYDRKDWTVTVETGVVQLEIGLPPRVDVIELRPGDRYRCKPGTVYRLRAIKASRLYQVSTPETEAPMPVDSV